MEQLLELLAQSELFSRLESNDLARLAKQMEFRDFRPGQTLVRQGEEGNEFFILLEGRAQIVVENTVLHTERAILSLEKGQSFGEAALLTSEPRTATVRALESTVCAVLTRESFTRLFEEVPAVSRAMAGYLARRLAVQCRLEGPVFVKLGRFPYRPELFRLLPDESWDMCRAVPLQLDGRILSVAMVEPEDMSCIERLRDELPGFRLECAACSEDDYRAFLNSHRLSSLHRAESVGTPSGHPMDWLVSVMQREPSGTVTVELIADNAVVFRRRGNRLTPIDPAPTDEVLQSLRSTLTSYFLTHETIDGVTRSVRRHGQTYLLSVDRFEHRAGVRYTLKLRDHEIHPVERYLPSQGMQAALKAALLDPRGMLLIDKGEERVSEGVLNSLIADRARDLGGESVLYLGWKSDRSELPCTIGADNFELVPYLRMAGKQGVEVAALCRIGRGEWRQLIREQTVLPSIVGIWDEGSLEGARSFLERELHSPESVLSEFLVLQHRLVPRNCRHCATEFRPPEEVLALLRERGWHNEQERYFRGEGCSYCSFRGVDGAMPLFSVKRARLLPSGEIRWECVCPVADSITLALSLGRLEPLRALASIRS